MVNRLLMTSSLIFLDWHVSTTLRFVKILSINVIINMTFLYLSATKENVDIEDLVDDFITFYFGGQDSTMSMLIFALVLTLLHPHVQER